MLIVGATNFAAFSPNEWYLVAIPATATIIAAWITGRAYFRSNRKTPKVNLKGRKKEPVTPLDATTEGFVRVISELSRIREECETRLDGVERKNAVLEERYRNLEEQFNALKERYERVGRA